MGCPKGWLDYEPIGKVIPTTRIVAFKTPLKRELHNESSSDPTHDRFTPQDCIKAVKRCSNNRKRLGLVLNLTFTTKYYNPRDFERSGIHYGAIKCPGHEIPNEDLFYQFQRSLYDFFYDYPDRNVVVGVHCTHGVNRTGYMIARFLIQCEGWNVEEAITTVGDSRGYPIERENYIAHLNNLHMPSHMFPKIPTAKDLEEKQRKRKWESRSGDEEGRNGDEQSCKGADVAHKSDCKDDQSTTSKPPHQEKHQTKNGKHHHIQSSKNKGDLETENNCSIDSTKNQDFSQTIQPSEELETDGFIPLN